LETLRGQTLTPDEIVICDGGSSDGTWELLEAAEKEIKKIRSAAPPDKKNLPAPLRVLRRPDVNIAVGRNEAIAPAYGEVIAVTDAGCLPDKNWLEELVKPFADPQVKAVAGRWRFAGLEPGEPRPNLFQRAAAAYLGLPDESAAYLPSSRSVAFRKEVWAAVRGYPTELTFAGEDTLFDLRVQAAGYSFYQAPRAIVRWPVRRSLPTFLRMAFRYGRGDGEANLNRRAVARTWVKFSLAGLAIAGAAAFAAHQTQARGFATALAVGLGASVSLSGLLLGSAVQIFRRRPPFAAWGWFILLTWFSGPAYLWGRLTAKPKVRNAQLEKRNGK
jgi:glycosyltransferase involved in cell wall biosynthesis